MSIPHLFRCPISLDLFTDPVTLSTGQTYDRPSIERWLASGHLTCPVTMQRLRDPTLVPNHTLRHLIDQWLLSGVEPNHRHRLAVDGGNAELSLGILKPSLQSADTSSSSKLEMLKKVRILAAESDTGKNCLIQMGFFPLLLQLLFGSGAPFAEGEELELAEVALDCVLGLTLSTQLDHLNMLRGGPNLAAMLDLLDRGNIKVKAGLSYLIETIASFSITSDLCLLIGQSNRVVGVLVSLLQSPNTSAAEAAARALSALCASEPNRALAVKEGAVDGLVNYLSAPGRSNAGKALATIEHLVVLEEGKKALLRNPNDMRVLVKMVFRVSSCDDGGGQHAVGALLVACRDSARARAEAVNAGLLSQLLLLLQSQCGAKGKAKARALLRSMWAEGPFGM